ncbi:hypothetical protein, partial [Helicobacter pullorum]
TLGGESKEAKILEQIYILKECKSRDYSFLIRTKYTSKEVFDILLLWGEMWFLNRTNFKI